MAGKNTATFGIYQTQADVEYAVDALRSEGFRDIDVSVLFPENEGTKDFAVEKNTQSSRGNSDWSCDGRRHREEFWAGLRESGRWPFQELARS